MHTPTYVEVLLLFTHCRWMNTSIARQECATLSLYTMPRTTDTTPLLSFVGCQNSTALTSLHCSIRSRVVVNFVVCPVSMLVGAPRNCTRFDCRYGFHEDVLDSVYVPYFCTALLYPDTVRCPGDNSIRLGRTGASKQNSTTTNARSMSYRYTGVMLYQALCGVQRQL